VAARKVSASLQKLRDALETEKTKSGAGRREAAIEKALDQWRSTAKGEGHNAFFRLGAALHRAGLDESEIGSKLRDEAAYGHSPRDRRAEVTGILKSLRRRGSLTGRRSP